MSTNHKIRQIADRLPEVPKLHNGKIQYDGYGKVIMLNHFREIKEIYDKCGKNIERRNFLCDNYVRACFEYDEVHQQYLKKKSRPKRVQLIVFVSIMVIALIKLLWDYLN